MEVRLYKYYEESIMKLAEFETIIQNGVISIPVEYLSVFPEKSKIMVKIESLGSVPTYNRNFNAICINTKGLKFNRDEANAR
jgi:hypothetical protein